MAKRTYDKLVRDKIPDIIRSNGEEPEVYVLPDWKFIQKLEEKLREELDEYLDSKEIEELADLAEVVHALVEAKGYTWDQFEEIRWDKVLKRGAFDKKLCLKCVKTTDHVILHMKNGQTIEYDAVEFSIIYDHIEIRDENGTLYITELCDIKSHEIHYASKK